MSSPDDLDRVAEEFAAHIVDGDFHATLRVVPNELLGPEVTMV